MISPGSFRQILRPINHGKEKKPWACASHFLHFSYAANLNNLDLKKTILVNVSIYWYFHLLLYAFVHYFKTDQQSEAQHLLLKTFYVLWFSFSTIYLFIIYLPSKSLCLRFLSISTDWCGCHFLIVRRKNLFLQNRIHPAACVSVTSEPIMTAAIQFHAITTLLWVEPLNHTLKVLFNNQNSIPEVQVLIFGSP